MPRRRRSVIPIVGSFLSSNGDRLANNKAISPRYNCIEPSKEYAYLGDGRHSLLAGGRRRKTTFPQQVVCVSISDFDDVVGLGDRLVQNESEAGGFFLTLAVAYRKCLTGGHGINEYGRFEPLFDCDRDKWNFDNGPSGAL